MQVALRDTMRTIAIQFCQRGKEKKKKKKQKKQVMVMMMVMIKPTIMMEMMM